MVSRLGLSLLELDPMATVLSCRDVNGCYVVPLIVDESDSVARCDLPGAANGDIGHRQWGIMQVDMQNDRFCDYRQRIKRPREVCQTGIPIRRFVDL